MLRREDQGAVAVLRMEHGKVNAMDLDLLQALARELSEVERTADRHALVLTGSRRIFCAGVDLFRFVEGGADYLDAFFRTMVSCFRQLFLFPRPVIAAVNGHAIAGGCVLASAADYRVMGRDAGTIGVPELKVGIPFPTPAIEILRFAASTRHLQQLVYLGKTYDPEAAHRVGLVDELVDQDLVTQRALQIADELGSMPVARFGITKRQLRAPSVERMDRIGAAIDPEVLAAWKTPETHAAIREYAEARGLGK